jgi:hypothetical protein
MGATLPFHCPVEGCQYSTSFRLGMGEEMDPDAHEERAAILREEHPDHLPADWMPVTPSAG